MISVIIPTYKNRELFLKNLRHNLKFLEGCEIIVVNDDPTTSVKVDLESFKKVILIENKTNLGFGGTINTGAKRATGKHLLLLNNDVLLNDDSFKKALKHFENDEMLFAVSFSQKDHGETVGKNSIYWHGGFVNHKKAANHDLGPNAWAEGGSCLIAQDKFNRLGGFDQLYKPFYWEDVDLSYRAWKAGYKTLFDPAIQVIHDHESTIGKYFKKDRVNEIAFRNQLIFIWKNLEDRALLIKHFVVLPKFIFNPSFWRAVGVLPEIIKRRKSQKELSIISDNAIFQKFT